MTEEDERLWRRLTASVREYRRARAAETAAAAAKPSPSSPPASMANAPLKAASAPSARPKPPPQRATGAALLADRGRERRVKRGQVALERTLDLHGMNQDQARAAVGAFVRQAAAGGCRCVLIVTGKGRRSEGEGSGVLKQRLPQWLSELKPIASSFAQAHHRHGGAGAFYVFIRPSRVED